MRVFLAGATGVIGVRLVPLLLEAGHHVAGMTRTPAKADSLAMAGAEPVVCDVFDADSLRAEVVGFRPDVVLDQLTDLPDELDQLREVAAANARIRREGTRNLLHAATAAGTERFVVQSVAWTLTGDGAAAVGDMEQMVLRAAGVVVRYGQFYGPGTFHPDGPPEGSRIHIDTAARRTLPALRADPGILTIAET